MKDARTLLAMAGLLPRSELPSVSKPSEPRVGDEVILGPLAWPATVRGLRVRVSAVDLSGVVVVRLDPPYGPVRVTGWDVRPPR